MIAPQVTGPRDVPALRSWMVEEWKPGRAFASQANRHIVGRPSWAEAPNEAFQVVSWNFASLAIAELWWVDATMVDLLETSCQDLPPCTLTRELVPAEPVLCIFERPIQGINTDNPTNTVLVDGMLWGWASGAWIGKPILSATIYSRYKLSEPIPIGGGAVMVSPDSRPEDEIWTPLGRTNWPLGNDWAQHLLPSVPETTHVSNTEDRRWLATLWALAASPNLIEVSHLPADRPERRRAKRAGLSEPTVKIVNLRRSVYVGAGAEREPLGSSGRRYKVRWPVKGHWRQQPYGPGRALRKPVRIEPFIKGPPGAPMKEGATVHVLR